MEKRKKTARDEFWKELEAATSELITNNLIAFTDHDVDSSGPFQLPLDIDSRVNITRIKSSHKAMAYGLLLLLEPADARALETDIQQKFEEQDDERPVEVCLILGDVGERQKNVKQRGLAVGRVVQFAPDTELKGTVRTLISMSPQTHLWDVKVSASSSSQQMLQENLDLISTTLFVVAHQKSKPLFDEKILFLHSFGVRLKNFDKAEFIVRKINNKFLEMNSPSSVDLPETLQQVWSGKLLKDEKKLFKIEIEMKCEFEEDRKHSSGVTHGPDLNEKKKNVVFSEQKKVAKRLFNRVKYVLSQSRRLESFDNLCWIILVPNFTSLRDQTLERLTGNPKKNQLGFTELLWPAEENGGEIPWTSYVMEYTNANQGKFCKFKDYVLTEKNKNTLFVIVADESHWGYVQPGAHDNFVNDAQLLEKDNLIVVQVSATPYNNLTMDSRVPWKYISGVVDGNIECGNIIENPTNSRAVEMQVTLPCTLLEFKPTTREAFKSAVVEIAKNYVKSMHEDKVFLKVEEQKERGRHGVQSLLVTLKIITTKEEMEQLVKGLTPEKLISELEKRHIDPDPLKVKPASDRSCKSEDVSHLEELHVVKWHPPRDVGQIVHSSKYLRFEDILRTIPSRIRHDSVSRGASGYSSHQCGTIKRPLSAQLIRKDKFLAPLLLECTTYQDTITKEHLWLVDMVFSLLYFDTFRWKDQGGLEDIAESRKCVMKSEQDFVWHENLQPSEKILKDKTTFYDEQSRFSAPKFLERFRLFCGDLSAIDLCHVKGSKSQMKEAAEKFLDGLVLEFNELVVDDEDDEDDDVVEDDDNDESLHDEEQRKKKSVAILLFNKLLAEPKLQSTDVSRFISESDRLVLDLLESNWQQHTCRQDDTCKVWSVCGSMKIVRITETQRGLFVAEALRVCRDKLFLFEKDSHPFPPFAILTDFGSLSLWKVFEKQFQMLHLTSPGSGKFLRIYDRKPDIVYKDLEGLPCILILLEKGRMGDTFPESFNCLDLRLRTSENCSTCIQELGRVCRYPAFSSTRKIGDWDDIELALGELHLQTPSLGYGSDGCPEGGCNTHVGGACQPKTQEISGEIPPQTPATFKRSDKPLAVTYGKDIFVGYATHMLPWGGITDWKMMSHDMHMSTARYVFTCKVLKVERPRIQLSLKDETKGISLEDCRLVVNRPKEFLPFYSFKSRDEKDPSWITLQQDKDKWQSDLKENDEVTFFRDDSSLMSLFDEAIRLSYSADTLCSEFRGTCSISALKYPLPCVLVLGSVMKKLEDAVDKADLNFPRQIWECINLTTLDKHVNQGPDFKGQVLSKLISSKRSSIHEYRTAWVASKGSFVPATEKRKERGTKPNADYLGKPGKYRSEPELHQRRFVLSAETQIGKTGAYYYFLSLLSNEIGKKSRTEPSPPTLPPVPTPNAVTCARHEWMRPYWRDLSKDEWGQKGNLYVRQGKYHPRMRLQRCVPRRV